MKQQLRPRRKAIGARGEPESGRAPTSRCGARSRPARARPPPSSLRPRRTSPSSRSASAAPRRASHSESRSGSGASRIRRQSRAAGDTEQSPRGRQGTRRTRPPSASAATAEQTPWPAEKPRRKAAGRNSSGTRRRRSFWAGPVVVGVSTRSAALAVGALAFPGRRIPGRGHCGQFCAHGVSRLLGIGW